MIYRKAINDGIVQNHEVSFQELEEKGLKMARVSKKKWVLKFTKKISERGEQTWERVERKSLFIFIEEKRMRESQSRLHAKLVLG